MAVQRAVQRVQRAVQRAFQRIVVRGYDDGRGICGTHGREMSYNNYDMQTPIYVYIHIIIYII